MEQHLIDQIASLGWKQLGVSAIFLIMEVLTIIYFYKHIQSQQKETVELTGKVQQALTMSVEVIRNSQAANDSLKRSVDEMIDSQNQFISYLKGRDSVGR